MTRLAICDPDAFYPLRALVEGPFEKIEDFASIERFIRTVLLHDEIEMELTPFSDDGIDREEGEQLVVAIGPTLTNYPFFHNRTHAYQADFPLPEKLLELSAKFAYADEGNYFEAHVNHLAHAFDVTRRGIGSALLCSEFGRAAFGTAENLPQTLFRQLDADWQTHLTSAQQDGLGLRIGPVTAIILSRCGGKRERIPTAIGELRDEWSKSRSKLWEKIDDRRTSNVADRLKIDKELQAASVHFSPYQDELDSKPVRFLWDIVAATSVESFLSWAKGDSPVEGVVKGTLTGAAKTLPGYFHDFKGHLFGVGAFDLAKKVRREVSKVELNALNEILTESEMNAITATPQAQIAHDT